MPKVKDLTGQRFGRLVALNRTGRHDKKGSVYWRCRCDCGNELEVTENSLVFGNYRSCGCRRQEVWKDIHNKLHRMDGTCVEWIEKRKSRSDNTSGFRGVTKLKNGRYRVGIGFKGQRFHVGNYGTYEEAVEARKEAEELIHGGFLRAYYTWKRETENGDGEAKKRPLIFEVQKINGNFRITTNMGQDAIFSGASDNSGSPPKSL